MRFRTLAATLALFGLAFAALVAATAVAGVRLGLMPYPTGLTLMTPAAAMGLIALTCALAWLFSALRHNDGTAKRSGMIALIGSLLFLWPPLHTLYNGATAPPIYDATTDPEDPPQFVVLAKLRQPGMTPLLFDGQRRVSFRGETGTVSYILHEYYPRLTKPNAAFMAPSKAFWRNFEVVKRMGWSLVDYNEKQGRIEAQARSFWFGQISDIVIRIEPAGREGARLDVRAQSETGAKDFGRNLGLLQDYFRQLNR